MSIIYLLESINEDRTVYKIGYTKKSVEKRILQLQTGNGYNIKEVCRYYTGNGMKIERVLHNFYSYCRLEGEWFEISLKDVANFLKICERIEYNLEILKKNQNYI